MAAIFIKSADKDKRKLNYEKIGEGATKKEITEIIFKRLANDPEKKGYSRFWYDPVLDETVVDFGSWSRFVVIEGNFAAMLIE